MSTHVRFARTVAALALGAILAGALPARSAGPPNLRAKIEAAYARVRSYKLTVLGSVRSVGVWVAPDRYHMTTDIAGKPLETVIVGNGYWTKADGKWERSGTTSSNLDIDAASLLRVAKQKNGTFAPLPDVVQDGKTVGTFGYTLPDGTNETCNYDRSTYLISRCKADQVTILYSGFNDKANIVPRV